LTANDFQEELDWMRRERKGEDKKPRAAPGPSRPEQREAADKLRARLDELCQEQMEPVQQAAPESKHAQQPEEDNEEAPEAREEEEPLYEVKRGDSRTRISEKVYGNTSRWREIYKANKVKTENPRLIYPKQKLRIS
jgi:nucleoid-associated protein YgaU